MKILLLIAIVFVTSSYCKRTQLRCIPIVGPEYCDECPQLGSCECNRGPFSNKFQVTDFDTGVVIGCCVANGFAKNGTVFNDPTTGQPVGLFKLIA